MCIPMRFDVELQMLGLTISLNDRAHTTPSGCLAQGSRHHAPGALALEDEPEYQNQTRRLSL